MQFTKKFPLLYWRRNSIFRPTRNLVFIHPLWPTNDPTTWCLERARFGIVQALFIIVLWQKEWLCYFTSKIQLIILLYLNSNYMWIVSWFCMMEYVTKVSNLSGNTFPAWQKKNHFIIKTCVLCIKSCRYLQIQPLTKPRASKD